MPICSSCAADLRPEWKFCVVCGVGVAAASITPNPATSAALATLLAPKPAHERVPKLKPTATLAPEPPAEPELEVEAETDVDVDVEAQLEPEAEAELLPELDDPEPGETELEPGTTPSKLALYGPLVFSAVCFIAAGAVITWLAINVWF